MIKNLPTHDDFLERSESFFHLAIDSMVQLSHLISEIGLEDDDELTDEYWTACQPKLSNAVILTQQALEFGLKARICEVSPYLLLNLTRDLPSGSRTTDKEYSEFKTIDANDLVAYVNAFSSERVSSELQDLFENTRVLRNSLIHTVDKKIVLLEKDIYQKILLGFALIFGDGKWMSLRFDYHQASEKSIVLGENAEVDFYTEVDLLTNFLTASEWKRYFGISKSSRRYICPLCANSIRDFLSDDQIPRWALLEPNSPTSTTLKCHGCSETILVVRKNCPENSCRGNVLEADGDLCLTCNR